jgi:hypothetical protein
MPSSVRFAYARHAPSPRNWYSQENYEGCLIAWDPIPDTVGVVAIRTAQNLPENCALDLMAGRYQQVAEQLLIKRPIDALVDDQIHEHNRYLILVRTAAGAFVAPPLRVEKFSPDTDRSPLGRLAFWSNPYGRPKGRDPTRLDYAALRPDPNFNGFYWSYPDHIPDLVGYHFIVSPQAIGALSGDAAEIAQLREVLVGKTSQLIKIEPFVTHLIDNITPPGRYAYFALLACDSNGGRTQIPIQHTSSPFSPDTPCRYAQPQDGIPGHHPDRMQQAFTAWRQRMAPALAALSAPPPGAAPPAAAAPPPPWSVLKPQKPPHLTAYQSDPQYLGMALRWDAPKGDPNTRFVALRADRFPPDQAIGPLLTGAAPPPPFCHRLTFSGPADTLIDTECHKHVWYCLAILDNNQLRPLTNLSEKPLTRLPPEGTPNITFWHCPSEPLKDRLPPTATPERLHRTGQTPLPLSWGTNDNIPSPVSIDIYHLTRQPDWTNPQDQAAWALLLRGEQNPLGSRASIPPNLSGIRDDLLPPDQDILAFACARDARNNSFVIDLFTDHSNTSTSWPLLSNPSAPPPPKQPLPDAPFDKAVIALPPDANLDLGNTDNTDDDIGLSTLDELNTLGAPPDSRPSERLADRLLPSVNEELLSAEMPALPSDATPSSPITGITSLSERLKPQTSPSDISWLTLEPAWHLNRLSAPAAPGPRWLILSTSPTPPPLHWDRISRLSTSNDDPSPDLRLFLLNPKALLLLDNISQTTAHFALVTRDNDNNWGQLSLSSCAPPWPPSQRVFILDPEHEEKIDRLVSLEIQQARMLLRSGAPREQILLPLQRAHTIWPQHSRAVAFEHALPPP